MKNYKKPKYANMYSSVVLSEFIQTIQMKLFKNMNKSKSRYRIQIND